MARFVNPLDFPSFVDAMILDDVADGQNDAVAEIVRLSEANEISVRLPYSVKDELAHPSTPAAARRAEALFLFSLPVTLTAEERVRFEGLVEAAKGEAKEKNIRRDLFHVWEASKYGAGYFITRDKRLLGRNPTIARHVQTEVVLPIAFLNRVAEARSRVALMRL